MIRILAISLILALVPLAAAAKSLALVIGNDRYQSIEPLQKARADARGYDRLLTGFGFAVTRIEDADTGAMAEALADFYQSIDPGDTVVFVYSGHGWSDGRVNYLVATDIRAEGSEALLAQLSTPLRNGANGVLDQIERRNPGLTVAVIDACRNNPFAVRGMRSFALGRGLVQEAAPAGTFIAFSAGEGQTALDRLSDDDTEQNSVFTRYFLSELAKPQDLQTAFKATQAEVYQAAQTVGHAQRPAYYDEVVGAACLSGRCETGAAGTPRDSGAASEWPDFRDSNSIAALEGFIRRHPGSAYADLAAERIARLKAEGVAVAVAAPPDLLAAPRSAPTPDQPRGLLPDPVPALTAETVVANLLPPGALAVPEPADTAPRAGTAPQVEAAAPANPDARLLGLSGEFVPSSNRSSLCLQGSPQAKVICQDMTLGILDWQAANLYADQIGIANTNRRIYLATQRAVFERDRETCGLDRGCLVPLYRKYLDKLLTGATRYDEMSRRDRVRLAQGELIRLGCLDDTADGVIGPKTRAALEKFRSSSFMPLQADIATAAVLGLLRQQPDGFCR